MDEMRNWIVFCQSVRGLFLAGLLLAVLFSGEPSLLDAIIGWIERH